MRLPIMIELHQPTGCVWLNFFMPFGGEEMADYAFRTLEDRRNLQDLYETGLSPRELSEKMEKTVTVIYTELRRGRDGTRLEDGRLKYDATVAQRAVNRSLERRGRKASRTSQGAT